MKFPITILKENNSNIYVYRSDKHFKKTTRELLNSGVFKGCKIYDSAGFNYKIIEVKEIGYSGLIKGWHPFYKGTLIWVNFKFERTNEELSIDLFKNHLKKIVSSRPNIWTSSGGINDIFDLIDNAKSFEKVMLIFG